MKNLIKAGIQLRVEQAILDKIIEDSSIDQVRDDMANHIMQVIDEIASDEDLTKENSKISSYLEKSFSESDGWLFTQQFINIAIINAHHYGESGLAIPKNEKVLSFLLPKLTEKFNVVFVKMEKNNLLRVLEENNKPSYFCNNWNFYKLTAEEE